MRAFISEKARHPELNKEYQEAFVEERKAHLRSIMAAGVERGDLPANTDVDLAAEIGPALLYHRLMVSGAKPDEDLPRRIVEHLLGPAEPE